MSVSGSDDFDYGAIALQLMKFLIPGAALAGAVLVEDPIRGVLGTSFGAVDEYLALAYRDELFQGGFIWDFADQAIALVDRYGTPYFGYGGDCGEAPHNGDFSANGMLFADHSPKPAVQEMKFLYQGFVVAVGAASFELTSRMLFTSSSAYERVAPTSSFFRTSSSIGGCTTRT